MTLNPHTPPETGTGPEQASDLSQPSTPRHPDASDALVSMHAAALQSNVDSFPVLKAFQDYLEAERQRARRRMIWMSGFFLAALIVVIFGMLTAGILVFSHYTRSVDRLQDALVRTLQARETGADRSPAPAIIENVSETLETRLGQRFESVDAMIATLESREIAYRDELQTLHQALDSMQATNRLLRGEILAVQAEWPTLISNLTEQVASAVTPASRPRTEGVPTAPVLAESAPPPPDPAPMESMPASEPSPMLPAQFSGTAPTPQGFRESTVRLTAPDDLESLPWRLLIPE